MWLSYLFSFKNILKRFVTEKHRGSDRKTQQGDETHWPRGSRPEGRPTSNIPQKPKKRLTITHMFRHNRTERHQMSAVFGGFSGLTRPLS
jgi:hypothetical protein